MDRRSAALFLGTCLGLVASSVNATIVTVFDGIPAGTASFDTTVTNAGGTVVTDNWSGLPSGGTSLVRTDYTLTRNNAGTFSPTTYGTMTGQVVDISPDGWPTPHSGTVAGGVTFTFNNPVNSFGFEVGDWATCCHNPTTDLFISFDGGAPILVASASSQADGLFPNADGFNVYEIFVAAFDDSSNFSTVQFWGNGSGEYLVTGGTIRYAVVPLHSLNGGLVNQGLQLTSHNGIGVTRLNMGNVFHRLDGRLHGGLEGQFDDLFSSYNQTADSLTALAYAIGSGENDFEHLLAQVSNWNLQEWQQRQMAMNPSLYSDLALHVDESKPNPFADLFRVGNWRGNLVVRHHTGDHKAAGMQNAYDFSGYSATIGLDTNIGEKGLFGVALGYGREESNTLPAATRADNDTKVWSLMAYGSYELKDTTYINGVIGLGRSDHSVKRRSGGNILVGKPDGQEFMLAVRGGRMFKSKDWAVGPYGGIQYAHSKVDAYTESGVGAQYVGSQNASSLIAEVGFQGSVRLKTKGKYEWVPQIRLSLEKEFKDSGRYVNVGPVGGALTPIQIQSKDEDLYARADLGLAVNFPDPRSSLRLDYEKVFQHRSLDEQAVTLRFRWLFN